MTSVHLLWHVHNDDEKLIGVYGTNADAASAKERLRQKPGFVQVSERTLLPYTQSLNGRDVIQTLQSENLIDCRMMNQSTLTPTDAPRR